MEVTNGRAGATSPSDRRGPEVTPIAPLHPAHGCHEEGGGTADG